MEGTPRDQWTMVGVDAKHDEVMVVVGGGDGPLPPAVDQDDTDKRQTIWTASWMRFKMVNLFKTHLCQCQEEWRLIGWNTTIKAGGQGMVGMRGDIQERGDRVERGRKI